MVNNEIEFITPPNTLKSKVSGDGTDGIDQAGLERAEQAIADMVDEYLEWVQKDISSIELSLRDVKEGAGDRAEKLQEVFQIAHDIKGQGGSFGYDLMTVIGTQVCNLINVADPLDRNLIDAIDVHINAMKLVVSKKLIKDGGREGALILSGLQNVCEKILG